MWATLTRASAEFTRPAYSSISFGLFPAAVMRVGAGIRVGTTAPVMIVILGA
jgi:hypothetical protein